MLTQTQPAGRASPFKHPVAGVRNAPPAGQKLAADTLDLMGALMPFARNSEIYGENEPADYLYKVVSGTVRTYKVLVDGRRQIGGFHLPETCSVSKAGMSTRFRRKRSPIARSW